MKSPVQEFYDRMFDNVGRLVDEIRSQMMWLVYILKFFVKGW